mgnify:CR=1 FL=1
MSRDSAMGGFGFDGFAVRRHEDPCHQTQAAEVLSNGVGLHNAIIVLQAQTYLPDPFKSDATMSSMSWCW